jgi:hypothetical protein
MGLTQPERARPDVSILPPPKNGILFAIPRRQEAGTIDLLFLPSPGKTSVFAYIQVGRGDVH